MNQLIKEYEESENKSLIDLLVLVDKLSNGNGPDVFESFVPSYDDEDNSKREEHLELLISDKGSELRKEMYERAKSIRA